MESLKSFDIEDSVTHKRNPVARSGIRAALVAAAGCAVVQAGPGITGLGPVRRVTDALLPLSGLGTAKHVALTFDDGPDQAATPQFLDELRSRGVRATFFLLGSQVAMAERLAGRIADEGHEVGVHGWDHRYLPLRGPRSTYDDLARARDIIAQQSGVLPWLFRPPYGVLSGPALVAARMLGLTPVLWSSWGREWVPGSTPESVLETLTSGRLDGGTVLLHDSGATAPPGSWQAALGALPLLLDECERRGLRVGPLGEHGPRWQADRAQRPDGPDARSVLTGLAARVRPVASATIAASRPLWAPRQ